MPKSEIEEVLANWIDLALSPAGQLPEGVRPPEWVAANFYKWWSSRAENELGEAEMATRAAREELARLGGSDRFGEVLDELYLAQEALAHLRAALGLVGDSE